MANLGPVLIRESIIRSIREYFYAQGFHEVIIPVLNRSVPHEENLHPFSTVWHAGEKEKTLYLSLSPERGIKRMLARGMENVFAIAKSFRDLEAAGSQHIPEFLMLEWYRKGARYEAVMEDARNLLLHVSNSLGEKGKLQLSASVWPVLSLKTLVEEAAKTSMRSLVEDDSSLFGVARKKGYATEGASWRGLWDQLFVNEIEPVLPAGQAFLTDFPSRLSPLARPKKKEPWLAERFELYLDKTEIANGNTEQTERMAVEKYFREEAEKRGVQSHPVDRAFLDSLAVLDGVTYAGCGLGIDRLAMLASGAGDIREAEQLLDA